jgi:hypothetical protein
MHAGLKDMQEPMSVIEPIRVHSGFDKPVEDKKNNTCPDQVVVNSLKGSFPLDVHVNLLLEIDSDWNIYDLVNDLSGGILNLKQFSFLHRFFLINYKFNMLLFWHPSEKQYLLHRLHNSWVVHAISSKRRQWQRHYNISAARAAMRRENR